MNSKEIASLLASQWCHHSVDGEWLKITHSVINRLPLQVKEGLLSQVKPLIDQELEELSYVR